MNKIVNNNEVFVKKYNELDSLIDEKFNRDSDESSIYFLINKYRRSRNEKERIYSSKLDSIRKIRNLMVHESGIIDTLFCVSDDVIGFLNELIEYIKHPLRAKDVMTQLKKIIFGKLDDSVSHLIKNIVEDGVSNIPILNHNNVVIGVFNSDVLLSILINERTINESTKVTEIKEFIDLENQLNLRFVFVTEEIEIDTLNDYFALSKEQYKKRLPIVFVSKDGKSSSELVGIISPIDLIRKDT